MCSSASNFSILGQTRALIQTNYDNKGRAWVTIIIIIIQQLIQHNINVTYIIHQIIILRSVMVSYVRLCILVQDPIFL